MHGRPARWKPRWLHRLSHSIKGRLVALFVLLALAVTAVFLLGSQRWLSAGWQVFAAPLVGDYSQRLAAELGSPPDPARARAQVDRLPLAVSIEGPVVNYQTHPGRFEHRRAAEHGGQDDGAAHGQAPWAGSVLLADGHRVQYTLVAPPEFDRPRYLGWLTLALLLGLTALAYAAVRHQLKPLEAITAGVQAFGSGHFGQPIAVRRPDELGQLAQRINTMAHSLHGMLDAKRALLLAISHELRSPLTRARVNAELLDDSAERQALLRDLGEMRDLISSLLESERLTAGHSALLTERSDLALLAREAAEAHALSHPQAAALLLQLPPPGTAWAQREIDPLRLRLLLRNLLDNAVRHGRPGDVGSAGSVDSADRADGAATELFLRQQDDGRLALGVRDHGPGVAPEHLSQLGQAFYRPDSARLRSSGGVGLGLTLCRLIALAHEGELRFQARQPGLEVAMVW